MNGPDPKAPPTAKTVAPDLATVTFNSKSPSQVLLQAKSQQQQQQQQFSSTKENQHNEQSQQKQQQPMDDNASSYFGQRRPARPPADPLSDRATQFLIWRVLCADHLSEKGGICRVSSPAPIQELLPPLTSRNDVDLQLYAFLAIILREFVQSWYAKITTDQTLVREIIHIVAHCTRALEDRLRNIDLEALLLDELPELLDRHIKAYRLAHQQAEGHPVKANPRMIYHTLFPLPHLSPVPDSTIKGSIATQRENETQYRQLLVQGVLAALLPTEDLENECLTSLVGQIISEMIIGEVVANKVAEPWFLWEAITVLAKNVSRKQNSSAGNTSLSSGSGPGRMVKPVAQKWASSWSIQRVFWNLIHWGFLVYTAIRWLASTVMLARSLPSRISDVGHHHGHTIKTHRVESDNNTKQRPINHTVKYPILSFKIGSCLSSLLDLDLRMPWLYGAVSWAQWMAINGPGRVAGLDKTIDRLLSHVISTTLLESAYLPTLLRSLRSVLFPNNALGTPTLLPPENGDDENGEALLQIRRDCARAVWDIMPQKNLARIFFSGTVAGFMAQDAARSGDKRKEGSRTYKSMKKKDKEKNPAETEKGEEKYLKSEKHITMIPHIVVMDAPSSSASSPLSSPLSNPSHKIEKNSESGDISRCCLPLQQVEHEDQYGPEYNQTGYSSGGHNDDVPACLSASMIRKKEKKSSHDASYSHLRKTIDDITNDNGNHDDNVKYRDRATVAAIEDSILQPFSDAYCNKHLLYASLELVLLRLIPELGSQGIEEMIEQRL